MKKYPYPDEKLVSKEEIRTHIENIVRNCMRHLNIDGYDWHIILPQENNWYEDSSAGASVSLTYPYKKFRISIQETEVVKMREQVLTSPFWVNLEQSMIHELMHVIIWRFSTLANKRHITSTDIADEEETLVDHLSIAFCSLLHDWRDLSTAPIPKAARKRYSTPMKKVVRKTKLGISKGRKNK